MKKLQVPTCCPSDMFDKCVQGISELATQQRLVDQKCLLEAAYADYVRRSANQTWCELPRAMRGHSEQVIVGSLTKGDLVALYHTGLVPARGAARSMYDEIKLLAHDECPYCGGCGELVEEEGIGTLDHFLPKSLFPIYSIFPLNLIPACATCNTGMGSNFSSSPELQPLHPYFDAPHFFDEKWTTATVSEQEPIIVTFDVNPPPNWSDQDKKRVAQHFKDCKLRGRYRTKVASDLSSLIDQRKTVHRDLSPEEFQKILRTVADNKKLPINGWRRSLYHGLADSIWFCSNNFQ